jgi:hypothetical protein
VPNLVRLDDLRTQVLQRSNREGDDPAAGFVTSAELNGYINRSWRRLYNLLVERFQDQFAKASAPFAITDATDTYAWATIGCSDFYKALGVDYQVGTYWQPVRRFNFADRGMQNPLGPLYANVPGLYDLRYQLRGDGLVFMRPIPSVNVRLWYVPVAPALVADSDTLDDVNGFAEYVVVDSAIKVLLKEESDTSALERERERLEALVISAGSSRDAGAVPTVVDTTRNYGGW